MNAHHPTLCLTLFGQYFEGSGVVIVVVVVVVVVVVATELIVVVAFVVTFVAVEFIGIVVLLRVDGSTAVIKENVIS